MNIKAIETQYKGYRFRSRLEARWAVLFDSAGIEWEYESEGYQLSNGQNYLPDFWLPKLNVFAEVKPGKDFIGLKKFYLAGKMDGWRKEIIKSHYCVNPFIPGSLDYTGHMSNGDSIVEESTDAIDDCDFMFAYISSLDCFGTLAEIGYAVAKNKPTFVAICGEKCANLIDTGGHGIYEPNFHCEFHRCLDQSEVVGHNKYDEYGVSLDGHSPDKVLRLKVDLGECWFAATMATECRVVANEDSMRSYFFLA